MRELNKWEKVGIVVGIVATLGIGYLIYKKKKPKFDLIEGQNTIKLSFDPKCSAQELINSINSQGGSAKAVSRYNATTGVWDTFNDGGSDDFNIELGQEYLVNCSNASIWTP
jgi:hypothetical protein